MDSLTSRSQALEGLYFQGRQQTSMEKYMRGLVDEGKLPAAALNVFQTNKAEVRTRPASEFVYRHVKRRNSEFVPPELPTFGLGQSVRLGGMSRWTVDSVSIFDVQEGRRLASTPRREPSIFEIKRAAAIEKAATETPLVGQYRLYPRLSPGRALFWGTICAVAGTMFGTKMACIVLDIKAVSRICASGDGEVLVQVNEVEGKMRGALKPFRQFMESVFTPVNGALLTAGNGSVEATSVHRFAARLKEKFSPERS